MLHNLVNDVDERVARDVLDNPLRTDVTVDQLSELTLLIVSLLETLNATLRFCEDSSLSRIEL